MEKEKRVKQWKKIKGDVTQGNEKGYKRGRKNLENWRRERREYCEY